MTQKGKIFKGYVEQIIAHHEFGSNKMVDLSPDYFCDLDTYEAGKLLRELIAEGYLRDHHTKKTFSHGSKGFKQYDTCYFHWIGITEKGWAIANRYLNA